MVAYLAAISDLVGCTRQPLRNSFGPDGNLKRTRLCLAQRSSFESVFIRVSSGLRVLWLVFSASGSSLILSIRFYLSLFRISLDVLRTSVHTSILFFPSKGNIITFVYLPFFSKSHSGKSCLVGRRSLSNLYFISPAHWLTADLWCPPSLFWIPIATLSDSSFYRHFALHRVLR